MSMVASDLEDLVSKMFSGHKSSLACLISKVENRDKNLAQIMRLLYPKTGRALVLGVSDPAGGCHALLVDQIATLYRAQGKRVAVLVAGDGVRLRKNLEDDEDVFVHWLELQGSGSLSHVMKESILVLDAAGFDIIFVETTGVRPPEFVQTAVVAVRESGDSIIVSLADDEDKAGVIAVHKTGETGVDQLVARIEKHHAFLRVSGKLQLKRVEFLKNEVRDILTERLSFSIEQQFETSSGRELLEKLSSLAVDPYQVSDIISGV
jgi:LAO/AO transport system kinase